MQLKKFFCVAIVFIGSLCTSRLMAQSTLQSQVIDQYENPIAGAEVKATPSGKTTLTDSSGNFSIALAPGDSLFISKLGYTGAGFTASTPEELYVIDKVFGWKDLLNPLFYIKNGGLWLLLFIVFAETGLMVGFFLPGDSLLFVAGIYSTQLISTFITGSTGTDLIDLLILWILITISGILGNMAGYWFGRKSGPFLFTRKDSFFFKRKHLLRAKDFYDKHGGQAIVFARFLPIIRTFAPIVAGIVQMEKKKFMQFNIIGCVAWVFSMLFAGHYLQKLFLNKFNFDLTKHLEAIVIGIVLITTLPVIYKLFFGEKKSSGASPSQPI
ncbi:MAG TPA: VTT domain-containing protein [Chitinophagaceae bacterium]|nr:VTT domain-containing protein [Chitinophagaceae bacterium]